MLHPIPFPTPPQNMVVRQHLPTHPPENPPSDMDVLLAVLYKQCADLYRSNGKMTLSEFVEAQVYEFNILQAKSRATAGPLSSHSYVGLELDHAFSLINQRLDTLTARLDQVSQLSTVSYNIHGYDGIIVPFKEVPFVDGTYPTTFPHNLPLLCNINVLKNLTASQRTSYYQGYHPGEEVPDLAYDQINAIRWAIGCRCMLMDD